MCTGTQGGGVSAAGRYDTFKITYYNNFGVQLLWSAQTLRRHHPRSELLRETLPRGGELATKKTTPIPRYLRSPPRRPDRTRFIYFIHTHALLLISFWRTQRRSKVPNDNL